MASLRLKFKDRNNQVSHEQITELAYVGLGVPFTRLFKTPEGYKAVCRNDRDLEKLLSKFAREEFNKHGITVITPPELRCKKSVFVRKLSYQVGKHTAEQLKQDIELRNSWAKIEEVVKIKEYTHCFKIIFEDTSMAEKALRDGFLTYNMSVKTDQIEQEKFVHIQTCFKCYRHNSHTTKDCTETQKVCSNCAETGHTYTECTNNTMGCINCKREGKIYNTHKTLSMSCPLKKQLIKTKTDEDTEQNKQTHM